MKKIFLHAQITDRNVSSAMEHWCQDLDLNLGEGVPSDRKALGHEIVEGKRVLGVSEESRFYNRYIHTPNYSPFTIYQEYCGDRLLPNISRAIQ